jgi:hypothetical protein
MKKIIIGLCLIVAVIAIGCVTQRTAYNTISSIEQTATLGFDDYLSLVLKGTLTTNSTPTVAKAFNTLQAAGKLAADASEAGTNALAPASLVMEATDLGNLISRAKQFDKK